MSSPGGRKLTGASWWQVRVIAISRRSKTGSYLCLLCCEGRIHTSKGINNVLSTHYYFAYGTSHLMCPVPDSCDRPSHISAVSTDVEFTGGRGGASGTARRSGCCPTLRSGLQWDSS